MIGFGKRFWLKGLIILIIWLLASSGSASAQDDTSAQDEISFYELEEQLMVTATKRKISVRKAPAIATVITADEIRNMGARNLMDVLKMVPGFGVSINSWNVNMFEVRGVRTTASEKILVMMDGHRLNQPYLGSALIHMFDSMSVDKIRQIEIIRGPGSALYGANAFVAVVNVITKEANDVNGVMVTIAGGSFDTKTISLLGGKSFKDDENRDLKIFGNIDYTDTDGGDVTIEADMLSPAPFSTAPGKADMSLEKKEAFLKVSYGDLTFRGHFLQNDFGVYIGLANALADGNSAVYTDYWTELSYVKSLTDKLSASFRAYFDYWEQDSDLKLLPEGFPGYPDGAIGRPCQKDRTLGTELQFDLDLSESNHLIAGFNFDHVRQYDVDYVANYDPFTMEPLGSLQNVTSWANFNKNVTRKVWAVYLQDEWAIKENLTLTAGVRHDNYDDFGGTTNPRFALVWNFLRNADMKLLYGQAFRAPAFVELYNDANPDVLGNPNLEPENIKTYEASMGYRFGNFHTGTVNYFRNDIDDLIIWDTSTSPGHYMNMGGAKIDGVEAVLMGKYSSSNYWKLSYTWQNPKDADTDEDLPNVPSQRAALSLNYEVCKYLNAHADVLWTGERPRVSGDDRGDMPSYTTVDLSLIAKNFYKNFEIQGSVHNLFDEEYEDPDLSGAQKLIPGDYPREGISALISLSYKF